MGGTLLMISRVIYVDKGVLPNKDGTIHCKKHGKTEGFVSPNLCLFCLDCVREAIQNLTRTEYDDDNHDKN